MTYTAPRTAKVFDHTTTEAVEGDYFKLPYQPTFRVVACIDLGDYVSYLVQSGSNTPEQWDVMKPAAELFEQERSRVEAYEQEMSAIIHEAAQEEIEEALGFLSPLVAEYDWTTESVPTLKAPDIQPKKTYYERHQIQIWNLHYQDYVHLGLDKFLVVDRDTREVLAIRQCYQGAKDFRAELLG